MKIGVFTLQVFGSLPLEEALDRAQAHGLDAVELGAGNLNGTAHCDPRRVVEEDGYADRLQAALVSRGLELSALSAHGNPLHPNRELAESHDEGFQLACCAARRLGVETVIAFSGCPGDRDGGSTPNWVTCPWPPEFLQLRDWQWNEVVIPYWRRAAAFAAGEGVRVAIEMHPGMVVYNPETLLRLRDAAGDTIGANFDPSHLFWQGIDPLEAVRELGRRGAIFHVHAKDTRIDPRNVSRNGVLDAKPYDHVLDRAWSFRSVGYGHGEDFWRAFVSELRLAGYEGVLSIEHEDLLASLEEGLSRAVETLKRCVLTEPPAAPWF